MADAVGVTRKIWDRAESGEGIRPYNARLIADYLGCRVADIFEVNGAGR